MSLYKLESSQDQFGSFFGNFNKYHSYEQDKKIDLYESNDAYKVIVDLPSVNKDQITIESDADSLEISVKQEIQNQDDEDEKLIYHLNERTNSDFRRKIKFSKFSFVFTSF